MGLAKPLEASVRYLAENLGKHGIRSNGIRPVRSRRWPLPASRTSASCWALPLARPLRRNVTIEEVGNTAAFLLSDLASGITGEITYVDGGFSHVMGLNAKTTRKLQQPYKRPPGFFRRPVCRHAVRSRAENAAAK
jgi:enoyl-[acyl-carrier protein] reductase I